MGMIFVIHDLGVASESADTIAVMMPDASSSAGRWHRC
jgi:ABC-type dipeptide/oligopeptide/nickel transport system ATPase component